MRAPTQSLAEALLKTGRERRAIEVPAAMRPASLSDGYRIQAEISTLAGLTPCGWKIGSTNAASQRRRGFDEPLYGRLYRELTYASPVRLERADFIDPQIEAEFGFRIGRDLPASGAPYGLEEVTAAIAALMPAAEIADGRCVDWRSCEAPLCVADNIAHGCAVLGGAIEGWAPQPLREAVATVTLDGALAAKGCGADVLGEPLQAMLWLANALARDGHCLRAGEVVISGTCSGLVPVGDARNVVVDFAGLGQVSIGFARPR